jgi:hypothetical protein
MSGKTIFEGKTPATQRADAVKSLITYIHNGQVPAEMPPFFKMSGELVLVKSNKGDCYYTTTPKTCSCPANTYHPGQPCKHQRQHFPGPKKSREELEAEGERELASQRGAKRLARPPQDSIRPGKSEGWAGGMNGPVNLPEVA